MEKVKTSRTKNYSMLRLEKEDLYEIIRLLDEDDEDKGRIKLFADGFKLNSISEIENIKKDHITTFKVEIHYRYDTTKGQSSDLLSIDLKPDLLGPNIYISNSDNNQLLGLFSKIDQFLISKESRARYFLSIWVQIPLILLLIISTVLLLRLFGIRLYTAVDIPTVLYCIIQLAVTFVWLSSVSRFKIEKSVLIFLKERDKSKSFGALAKTAFFSILVALITRLADFLFNLWTNSINK